MPRKKKTIKNDFEISVRIPVAFALFFETALIVTHDSLSLKIDGTKIEIFSNAGKKFNLERNEICNYFRYLENFITY